MRLWVVVNPSSGHGEGKKRGPEAVERLRACGLDLEVVTSEYPRHIYDLTRALEPGKYDGAVAVGGDGTLFELINGLVRAHGEIPFPIGQIPVGTGNSLARDLFSDSLDSAVQAICDNHTRPLDVIRYSTKQSEAYFTNVMGVGFVSDINARAFRFQWMGMTAYALATLLEIVRPRFAHTRVWVDGTEVLNEPTLFAEICNSRYTGGNMLMAPDAKIDDGLLDLVVCLPMKRLRLLRSFPKIFSGTHLALPEVKFFRGRRARIETDPPKRLSPDGEVFDETPVELECLPGFVEVFA
ncbi:MAG: diacylglycerol kinase family lipid kinase [Calditrichaeota bacterium]|nr:diacylglycerol kinase family lipid kinase [Calditrichota bacterium]